MDYNDNDFIIKNILNQVDNINKCINFINIRLKKYNTKYNVVKEQIELLNNKTHLKLDGTTKLLKFQNILIFNEIEYLMNMRHIIQTQLNTEIYKLSDKLTIMSISILNLNKDINQDPLTQIKKSKKTDNFKKKIDIIINNFHHIKELLLNIKEYNKKINNDMIKGNYHCKTLDMDISIKRIHIFIEYKRYAQTFEAIIDHFNDLSVSVINNLNNKSIFNFLVSDDENKDDNDNERKKDNIFSRVPSVTSLASLDSLVDTNNQNYEDDIFESKKLIKNDSEFSNLFLKNNTGIKINVDSISSKIDIDNSPLNSIKDNLSNKSNDTDNDSDILNSNKLPDFSENED